LIDCERDRVHPEKKRRPLPSGQVAPASVVVLIGVFLAAGVLLSMQLSGLFCVYVGLYLTFSVLYSLFLKELPIIDVFCISLGFVLRLYGGGEAFNVQVSDWLFLSVFLLAIFLGFGKRYSERRILGGQAGQHRKNLEVYPEGFLESALYLSGATVLITYAMYAITKPVMVYTVPLCVFGLMRYLMRIKSGRGGDPTSALLNDLTLLFTGILWVALVAWCVYS
jgi:4-hydroxybenzoate polyprenyltransferase